MKYFSNVRHSDDADNEADWDAFVSSGFQMDVPTLESLHYIVLRSVSACARACVCMFVSVAANSLSPNPFEYTVFDFTRPIDDSKGQTINIGNSSE